LYKSQYASPVTEVVQDNEESTDDLFNHMYKKRRASHNESELDSYLDSPIVPGDVDLLQWWICYNGGRYDKLKFIKYTVYNFIIY
jgi:hypothetical protein